MPNVGFYQPIGSDVLKHGKGAHLPKHVAMCVPHGAVLCGAIWCGRCSPHVGHSAVLWALCCACQCRAAKCRAAILGCVDQDVAALAPNAQPNRRAFPPRSRPRRLKSAFELPDDPSRMYGVTEEEAQVRTAS